MATSSKSREVTFTFHRFIKCHAETISLVTRRGNYAVRSRSSFASSVRLAETKFFFSRKTKRFFCFRRKFIDLRISPKRRRFSIGGQSETRERRRGKRRRCSQFLLAMVFIYFSRAKLREEHWTKESFYIALSVQHERFFPSSRILFLQMVGTRLRRGRFDREVRPSPLGLSNR